MTLGTCRHCGATLMQGAIGCLGCGRLVDDYEKPEPTGVVQTQLGTQVKDGLLDARWRLIRPLGRGQSATSWLAHDINFDRRVVVKVLDDSASSDAGQVERFERNARRLAGVDHKNVVAVLSMGRHRGQPFVAMRQAEGHSLAEHLHAQGGRLSQSEAAYVVAQLADAFDAVHSSGGPQGGLQPRAIFVSPVDGRVTLLDVRAGPTLVSEITEPTTRVSERLEWVAPEVLAGEPPSVRSDVFTLGCVAWELVCGAPPPRGSLQTLLKGGAGPVPAPSPHGEPLSAELRAAIVCATNDDPAARFASAHHLHEALAATAALYRPPKPPQAAAAFDDAPDTQTLGPAPQFDDALKTQTHTALEGIAPLPASQVTKPSAPRFSKQPELEAPPDSQVTKPSTALVAGDGAAAGHADAFTGPELETKQVMSPQRVRGPDQITARQAPVGPRQNRRRNAAIAFVLALLLLGLFVGFKEPAAGPPPPIAMPRVTAPGVPAPPEPARTEELAFETRTTPVAIQERRTTFEKTYGDEPGHGKGRLRATARTRPQVAEYYGKDRFGELQVLVLYGNREVSVDVSIDGQLVGPSPIFLPLKPGQHVITITRSPLEPVKVPVQVVEHKSVRMEIELVPLE